MKYMCLFELPVYGLEKGKVYSGELTSCNMLKIYDEVLGVSRFFHACLFQTLE